MKLNRIDSLSLRLPYLLKLKFNLLFTIEHFFGQKFTNKFLFESRLRLKNQIGELLSVNNYRGKGVPITEISDLSPQQFYAYNFLPGIPVVFKGVAKNWSACKEWDFDYFSNNFGKEPVIFVNHEVYGSASNKSDFEISSLEEYIKSINDVNDQRYARFHPLLDRHPELKEYLNLRWLKERMMQKFFSGFIFNVLFIGKSGSTTNCHNEGNDNLFLQIYGKKKWYLWPSDYLYAFHPRANRSPAKYCDINPENPQIREYLGYENLDYYETELEEGDILYVPSYTWHYTKNITPSIGVGTRWTSLKNNFRRSPLLCILEFLNTNPSLFSVFSSKNEFDFNKIILKSMGYKDHDINQKMGCKNIHNN